ncbi:MAG: PSD1 and planctomycete cytochrome C domain-containing protein [Bryobacteraceae bacterium]
MRLALVLAAAACLFAQDRGDFFESRIRPLLVKNCLSCHGDQKLGPFEITSREALLKGGKYGPAIVPGKPAESLLIAAVSHKHEKLKMPLNGRLTEAEIADLGTWIAAGATWPDAARIQAPPKGITAEQRAFWSFQPVRKPALPAVRNKAWPKNAVDHFILARLEAAALPPARPAGRRTLIRRATLDLHGLPPAPEEVDGFLKDTRPDAFARVVDRLLASPRYGERWGRYWLDVARYSDDKLDSTGEVPHPNAWRYRDWVIQAFNDDLPYSDFVKAQIAGDLMPPKERMAAGLGFFGLRPEQQDDRVDATTRGFLGLTVACAQCHDHKFDPLPTQDYYALLGVFDSSVYHELPLAATDVVERWEGQKKKVDEAEKALAEFRDEQATQLSYLLAARTADYLAAARGETHAQGLDKDTVDRWKNYLKASTREHPFLKEWEKAPAPESAGKFQSLALAVFHEKKDVDRKNLIRLGGSNERRDLANADLVSLERDKYFLWRDLYSAERGVYYYRAAGVERFLEGEWKAHAARLRERAAEIKRDLPEKYPFLHVIRDAEKPGDARVAIRGERNNPGEVVPRRFVSVLCSGEPRRFTQGSGRLELAEAIADPSNPLTARVMVNRIWQHHFGQGLVRTPGNFGQLGERPSHPELLDWLATRLMEQGWSVKAMHREIMLSATYALSGESLENNITADPENRLLWRFARRRLEVEALRDSLLFVAGELDATAGGPPIRLSEEKNRRRTVYGFVSRKRLDPLLGIFDFPNPNTTSEQRLVTNVPLQRLYFLNSPFVMARAEALSRRLEGSDADRIRQAHRLLFAREASPEEIRLGAGFLGNGAWAEYAQVLLSSNEFLFLE